MKTALVQSPAGSRVGSSSSLTSAGQGQSRGDQAAAEVPAQDLLWGGAGLGVAPEQPAAHSRPLSGPSSLGAVETSQAAAVVQGTLQAGPPSTVVGCAGVQLLSGFGKEGLASPRNLLLTVREPRFFNE